MKILIAIIVAMLFLTSCSESNMAPDQVVTEYWRLHKEGATGEALPMVVEEREYGIAFSLINEDAKPPLSNLLIFLDKYLEVTTDGYERDGDTAVVNILINKPRFEEILTNIDMISGNAEYDIENFSHSTYEGKVLLHRVNGRWEINEWQIDALRARMVALWNSFIDVNSTLIKVEANPEKGFHWPYFLAVPSLYIPESQALYLLVCPNNSESGDDDYQKHLDDARSLVSDPFTSQVSRSVPAPRLIPVFPRPYTQWWYDTQSLNRRAMQLESGPLARLDLQLIAMIQDAHGKLEDMGLKMEEKVLLNGFSSSGWFSIRFTMMHPEVVRAAAIGGNYTQILPIEELEGEKLQYPVGIADLEQLTGKAFNYDEYVKVKKYIYLGALDPQDTTYFDDCFERHHGEQIRRLIGKDTMKRWEKTQEIYKEAGAPAQFVIYEGIGHRINDQMINDIIEFFKGIDD